MCANSGSPVAGEIEVRDSDWTLAWDKQLEMVESRWTLCPECDCSIRVTGPKSKPRLRVHKGNYTR